MSKLLCKDSLAGDAFGLPEARIGVDATAGTLLTSVTRDAETARMSTSSPGAGAPSEKRNGDSDKTDGGVEGSSGNQEEVGKEGEVAFLH